MDWITDNIAIGNFLDAKDEYAKVDAILCLKDGCCDNRDEVDVFCVPLIDGPGNSRESIDEAIDTISSFVSSGGKILVHCHAGRSRSVCVVAAYFVRHHGMTPQDALDFVGAKRTPGLADGILEIFDLELATRGS